MISHFFHFKSKVESLVNINQQIIINFIIFIAKINVRKVMMLEIIIKTKEICLNCL